MKSISFLGNRRLAPGVFKESLTSGQSRFAVAVVSFSWCPACVDAFSQYKSYSKSDPDVRFVLLDGDAYDGFPGRQAPDYAFDRFLSRHFNLSVVPFYPGYFVLDDKGVLLRVTGETPQTQSLYGEQGLALTMKAISRARKSGPASTP